MAKDKVLRRPKVGRVTHGRYLTTSKNAVLKRNEQVRQMVARMRRLMPWVANSDMPACRGFAEIEIICANVYVDLMANGLTIKGTGEPRKLLDECRKLRQSQLPYMNSLGMTPASRRVLQNDKHADLPALLAQLGKVTPRGDEPEDAEEVPEDGED